MSWSWRLASAATLLLLVTSCGTTASDEDAGDGPSAPSSTAASTPLGTAEPQDPVLSPGPGEVLELDQHGSEYVFTKAGRYAVRLTPDLVYEVDSPDMWEVLDGRFFSTSDFSGGRGIFLVAEAPAGKTWLPAHPCRDRTRVPVGPTVRDLAEALATQPVFEATGPASAAIAGRTGVFLRLTLPDRFKWTTCDGGFAVGFTSKDRFPDWYVYGEAGLDVSLWILNVDGQRFVMISRCETACSDKDFEILRQMAESVTFIGAG
ncbi:hypothetical protein D0Z08_28680 [Nocardioides immobilis]|uniref:LppP/LprE family lipoprotein n=2 Tax=Nocardioides immobilis TaxID=2049295 RepID=A0A417XSX5_9ACTN|nr:hypothetical protein D0Z08_28680 [Nocardioides immobilis]